MKALKIRDAVHYLGQGWYEGYLWNILGNIIDGLEGHYTIIFNKELQFFIYKHGGYGNLISYVDVVFDDFLQVSEKAALQIKTAIENTIPHMEDYKTGVTPSFGAVVVFGYDFENPPIYFERLKELVS